MTYNGLKRPYLASSVFFWGFNLCFSMSLGRVGLCAAMPRGNAYLIARGKSHDPPELGLGAGATPEDPWIPNGDRVCIPP